MRTWRTKIFQNKLKFLRSWRECPWSAHLWIANYFNYLINYVIEIAYVLFILRHWNIGRGDLLSEHFLPIHAGKEVMLLNFIGPVRTQPIASLFIFINRSLTSFVSNPYNKLIALTEKYGFISIGFSSLSFIIFFLSLE